jgi:predicted esterase
MLIPAFRDALCQARIVVVVLTPSYLTRPNCLRELRWALDFERAGHLRVVLLSLHPAVTFEGRLQLVQDGPLKGLVFSSKEKKVKRLCPEAIALVERLNDVHMNYLPWHELQAWRSDGWVHANIAAHGGDPRRIFVMGHSSGAQLAALLCTDERRLRAHGVPFSALRGCVPVDGDTYDLPAIITTAETRRRAHGQPEPKSTHRAKFGTEEQHRDFSAVTHIAPGKGIPPFLILHVAEHPDNSAQAQRLGAVLRAAGVPVKVFGARETNHSRINNELGLPQDPCTRELWAFVDAHHGATR